MSGGYVNVMETVWHTVFLHVHNHQGGSLRADGATYGPLVWQCIDRASGLPRALRLARALSFPRSDHRLVWE